RRRHTRLVSDWSSDVCSSDLKQRVKRSTIKCHLVSTDEMVIIRREYGGHLEFVYCERFQSADSLYPMAFGEIDRYGLIVPGITRSEERRVGKGCRCRLAGE